jgi:hypothetical protein
VKWEDSPGLELLQDTNCNEALVYIVQEFKTLLDDGNLSPDIKEALLMTITVAGAATGSVNAQLLLLAVLVGSLADPDVTLRAAASELIESATQPCPCHLTYITDCFAHSLEELQRLNMLLSISWRLQPLSLVASSVKSTTTYTRFCKGTLLYAAVGVLRFSP